MSSVCGEIWRSNIFYAFKYYWYHVLLVETYVVLYLDILLPSGKIDDLEWNFEKHRDLSKPLSFLYLQIGFVLFL